MGMKAVLTAVFTVEIELVPENYPGELDSQQMLEDEITTYSRYPDLFVEDGTWEVSGELIDE